MWIIYGTVSISPYTSINFYVEETWNDSLGLKWLHVTAAVSWCRFGLPVCSGSWVWMCVKRIRVICVGLWRCWGRGNHLSGGIETKRITQMKCNNIGPKCFEIVIVWNNNAYRFLLNSHRAQRDFTATKLLRVHFNQSVFWRHEFYLNVRHG